MMIYDVIINNSLQFSIMVDAQFGILSSQRNNGWDGSDHCSLG